MGTSDPLAVVKFRGSKRNTKAVQNNLDPKWDTEFDFKLSKPIEAKEVLKVIVYDEALFGLRLFMCSAEIALRDVVEKGKVQGTYPLAGEEGRSMEAVLKVDLVLDNPASSTSSSNTDSSGSSTSTPSTAQAEDQPATGSPSGTQVLPQQGYTMAPGISIDESAVSYGFSKLPDKPLDFQVRVHVIEARRLFGNNLKPVVKVTCGQSIKQTSVRKGTNRPYWNETLVFNFKEKPDEFMKQSVDIKVLDSKLQVPFIKDTAIGSFKVDVGWVYNEPEHAIIHKWLLLVDPQEMSMSAKGYLKVSIIVVVPGGKTKHSPSIMDPDLTDIESNLLRPSGARLQPSTLRVRIYRGEDLPQMDPESSKYFTKMLSLGRQVKDDLVDAYTVVSFAGHKEVTKTVNYTSSPEWKSEVNLEVRFPSMCDKLKIEIIDHDSLTSDDHIGTLFIDLPHISATGSYGFLPTFGPSFVNVYGSPREYSRMVPRKITSMNKGKEEGVAYRGRALVEVDLIMGVTPKTTQSTIAEHALQKSLPYLQRKAYILYACFLNASMILPSNQSVHFEVSIGNYGNSLDQSLPNASSTTPHVYPVFDGNHYHHIPWTDTKPCVVVNSQWEDNSYRIAFLNILLTICSDLERNISRAQDMMEEDGVQEEEIKVHVCLSIDHFLEQTKKPMPTLPDSNLSEHNVTKLDVQLRKWRCSNIKEILKEAESVQKRTDKMSVRNLLERLEEIHHRMSELAFEPQISVPHVIIWMLVGDKRVSSVSIPAHRLMYLPPDPWSASLSGQGDLCGKAQTVSLTPPLMPADGSPSDMEGRAQVHLVLWLGMTSHAANAPLWSNKVSGETVVFAETYENQANAGTWGTVGLMRPHFSDALGKVSLPREMFEQPPGWTWDGDWFVVSGSSVSASYQESSTQLYEIYEVQERQPFTSFEKCKSAWIDNFGAELAVSTKYRLRPPDRWDWSPDSEWTKETFKNVDNAGWEYTSDISSDEWFPTMTVNRNIRRRKWTREMSLIPEESTDGTDASVAIFLKPGPNDGFEYARLPHLQYYPKAQTLFMARRRRWVRKMVPETKDVGALQQPVFYFKSKKSTLSVLSSSESGYTISPRITLVFPPQTRHRYQMRAYIYQARNMFASDNSGLSDPYAIMCYEGQSRLTQVCKNTLNPIWDKTLVIKDIILFGNPKDICNYLPTVTVEFYDKDTVTSDDFLGVIRVKPVVCLDGKYPVSPELQWFSIGRMGKIEGEVLAAFVLFLDEGMKLPTVCRPKPEMQVANIEMMCWGVRGMSDHMFLAVDKPLVELQCAGVRREMTKSIVSVKKFPNFPQPHLTMKVEVPKNPHYASPLEMRILDDRAFGWKPLIGSHVMSLSKEVCDGGSCRQTLGIAARALVLKTKKTHFSKRSNLFDREISVNLEPVVPVEGSIPQPSTAESEFDWWSKYYTSLPNHPLKHTEYEDAGMDILKVYNGPLEDAYDEHFEDLVHSYPLTTNTGLFGLQQPKDVGTLKAVLGVYPVPDGNGDSPPNVFDSITPMEPTQCLIRVYIVEGLDLQATDARTGKADPYITLTLGQTTVTDRDGYLANELNPKFGKVFELSATLPNDQTLTVSVKDRDRLSLADDLIGETSIDIENRYLTQYRAICGLPSTFSIKGMNVWRDVQLPVDILKEWCRVKYGVDETPRWLGTKEVIVGPKRYNLRTFEYTSPPHDTAGPEDQRLALYILRSEGLVEEHVETRPLLNPSKDIVQGQLRMWVDIFPKYLGRIPPAVNISPRRPRKYVLRVVIYNTKNIPLTDHSLITGEANTDIYVKGMLMAQDVPQKTDVHYRSVDGEGNFNWRFVFPFEYIPQEKTMVVAKKKSFIDFDKTESRVPPRLIIQIWDNDIILPDKYLGTMELDLSHMPKHSHSDSECSLDQLRPEAKRVSLLKHKKLRGWWPASVVAGDGNEQTRELTGKVEMELELLTEAEAKERPAGKGRGEPNMNPHLPEPNRPATSFFWFTSPLKTCNYIICKRNKRRLICCVVNCCILLYIIFTVLTLTVALIGGAVGLGFSAISARIHSGNSTSS
jgi:hypothetical protein